MPWRYPTPRGEPRKHHVLTTIPHVFILRRMNPLKHAEAVMGNQAALAKALKVPQQTVNNWARRGRVPAEHCPDIERVTQGAVTCEDLRPDVEWAVLRGCGCANSSRGDTALVE